MSERPLLGQLATDALARDPAPLGPPPSAEAEERAIRAIGDAIEREHARRRRATWMAISGGLALAASVVILLARRAPAPSAPPLAAARGFGSGEIHVLHEGSDRRLEDGAPLAEGDRVVAGEGHGAVALASGSQVSLDARADLSIDRLGRETSFSLTAGSVRADVAKLQPGERFVIRTKDAEVEVRGTAFRVAVGEARCDVETSVEVVEGTVWVRAKGGESIVHAGERWPSCAPPPAPPTAVTASATVPRVAPKVAARPDAGADTSALAEQNALFESALAAKRRGDYTAAVDELDRLLARFPSSPLVESAEAERMRALVAAHDPRARQAAERYLARFPGGFARADARAALAP